MNYCSTVFSRYICASFKAKCAIWQVDGTIVAPSSFKPYGSGLFQWILFTKLVGLTIQGGGTIDGSGSIWWKNTPLSDPLDDELKLIVPINGTHQQSTNSSVINYFMNILEGAYTQVRRASGSVGFCSGWVDPQTLSSASNK